MENKNHIEELFRETFRNFEEPVRPELWSKLQARIETPVSEPASSATSSQAVSGAGKMVSGSFLKWIAGAAIVLTSATGAYLYLADRSDKVEQSDVILPSDKNDNSIIESQSSEEFLTDQRSNHSGSAATGEKSISTPVLTNQGNQSELTNNEPKTEERANLTEPQTSTTTGLQTGTQTSPNSAAPTGNNQSAAQNLNNTIQAVNDSRLKIIASHTTGTAPLEVTFELNGIASETEWDFGDGESSRSVRANHTFNEAGSYIVTVNTTDAEGNKTTDKVNIKVLEDLTIKNIPTAFSPNQDGLNDIFRFEAPQFTEIEINIYDKTGKPVYKFTDPDKGWDGRLISGQIAPSETYLYTIFATTSDNRKHHQKGTIRIFP